MTRTKFLAISGSLRRDSHNRRLLATADGLLPADADLDVWAHLKQVPPFDEDDQAAPAPAVAAMRQALADADAVLIATPEYNGSVPSQLKNAVDGASRPVSASVLAGKPVAVVGASPTPYGDAWTQAEVRKALGIACASVVDRELAVPSVFQQFDPDGRLHDETLREGLRTILAELATHADVARTTSMGAMA